MFEAWFIEAWFIKPPFVFASLGNLSSICKERCSRHIEKMPKLGLYWARFSIVQRCQKNGKVFYSFTYITLYLCAVISAQYVFQWSLFIIARITFLC